MKIVAANHADKFLRFDSCGRPERLLLDAVGDDLRARYGEITPELPSALAAVARRLDDRRARTNLAA